MALVVGLEGWGRGGPARMELTQQKVPALMSLNRPEGYECSNPLGLFFILTEVCFYEHPWPANAYATKNNLNVSQSQPTWRLQTQLSPVPSFLPSRLPPPAQFNQSAGVFLHTSTGKMKQATALLFSQRGVDHLCWFTCESEQGDANALQVLPFRTSASPRGSRWDGTRGMAALPEPQRSRSSPRL